MARSYGAEYAQCGIGGTFVIGSILFTFVRPISIPQLIILSAKLCFFSLFARYKMASREGINMELKFIRGNGVSQKEKVKAFWKFLDAQNNLQPHKGILEHESPPETESLISSVEEMMKERDIWCKGLKIFRQLGLDKTALAADNRCKLCLVQKTIQYIRGFCRYGDATV
ncbi:uncharacterized protein LOC105281231 isoform X2 [Ooceraea biroi]|uniref:uncharacterized protein LOC105281231 isoform X2 n=1 Tax=Ooceraea biroi TaxID=2015173 RepID=UPI000971736D|nr:uncharacterized protein LOC105281231 isoform X2 [Ooceraea biroi]